MPARGSHRGVQGILTGFGLFDGLLRSAARQVRVPAASFASQCKADIAVLANNSQLQRAINLRPQPRPSTSLHSLDLKQLRPAGNI